MPAYQHGQRFPHESEGEVSVTVDGKKWKATDTNIYNDYSDCFAELEFAVSKEGIKNVQGNKVQGTKVFRNGMLLIERNGKTFNAIGAEVK